MVDLDLEDLDRRVTGLELNMQIITNLNKQKIDEAERILEELHKKFPMEQIRGFCHPNSPFSRAWRKEHPEKSFIFHYADIFDSKMFRNVCSS